MTQRLLRHKPSGVLHAYQDIYAMRPDFEEVIDVEARVVEPTVESKPAQRRTKAKQPPAIEALAAEIDSLTSEA